MKIFLKNRPGNSAKAGFTFVEVMFAVLLLTIMAIVAVSALTYPRHLAVMTARKQAAINVANEVLETAMATDYAKLPAESEDLDAGDHFSLHGQSLTVTRDITLAGGSGGVPEYKLITVTVQFPGMDNPVVLQTLKTKGN